MVALPGDGWLLGLGTPCDGRSRRGFAGEPGKPEQGLPALWQHATSWRCAEQGPAPVRDKAQKQGKGGQQGGWVCLGVAWKWLLPREML